MADGSRAQNERTGATSPESATRIQQATSTSPSSQLRSNTTVFGSASQIPPDSRSRVPSRTPFQSEADTYSMVEGENDMGSTGFGPELALQGLSENAHAYYNTTRSRLPEISVDYSFTEDCDLVLVIHSPHSPIVRYAVSKEVLSVSSRVLRPLVRELSEYRLVMVAGKRLGYLEMTGHPEAFRIILSILHFNPASDIRDINFKTFTRITYLSEMYQWQGVLEVWNNIWLDKYEPHALEPGYEDWLYIADIFGRNNPVESLVTRLGKECYSMEHGAMLNRRLISRGGAHLDTSLWSQEQLRRIKVQRQLRLSHLLWSLCELHSTLSYLCIEGRPNPNFRPENEICGSTICYCLAYGSLLRNINQAGWETGVSSISQMLQLWKGSVRDLEQKLGDVDFDTLEAVDPGHRCSLEDIGSSFFNCITESDIAQQDNIRRAFGRSVARHRGPTWSYTDSLAGSTLVNLSAEAVSRP
ncbi:hypothetical protein EYR41_010670 [Orbilia oligospora]|uniref:Uncharacterized protein n=1 Tax=Orbilia oligospora TaxID=2813651 RepID=A0A7C8TXZ4_ORBOL|nr:hypothetical protein TWF751_007249 [Orbilia oligospora]TGJ64625.1 hypothetical protein EYR41_010670 [Orbilia oligospora]